MQILVEGISKKSLEKGKKKNLLYIKLPELSDLIYSSFYSSKKHQWEKKKRRKKDKIFLLLMRQRWL